MRLTYRFCWWLTNTRTFLGLVETVMVLGLFSLLGSILVAIGSMIYGFMSVYYPGVLF